MGGILQAKKPALADLQKLGAGEGNRTLVVSLEGFCSTIELHPRRDSLLYLALLNVVVQRCLRKMPGPF